MVEMAENVGGILRGVVDIDRQAQAERRKRDKKGRFAEENASARRAVTAAVGKVDLRGDTNGNLHDNSMDDFDYSPPEPASLLSADEWALRVRGARRGLSSLDSSDSTGSVHSFCNEIHDKFSNEAPLYGDLAAAVYQASAEMDGTALGSTPHPSLGGPDSLLSRVQQWSERHPSVTSKNLAEQADKVLSRRITYLDWMAEGLRLVN